MIEANTKIVTKTRNRTKKKVKTTLLNYLDRQILLFFVERRTRRIHLSDLFDNFRSYSTTELQRSILRLCEFGILLLLRDLMLSIDSIPLLLQSLLSLKYNASASILFFIFKKNLFAIRRGEEVVFTYKDIQTPYDQDDMNVVRLNLLYYQKKNTFWHAVNELCKRGYLIKTAKGIYKFDYAMLGESYLYLCNI